MAIPETIPTLQLLLDFEMCVGEIPPCRISFIKHISRSALLYELSGLNYRLKPKEKITADTSHENQIKELRYFTKADEDPTVFSQYEYRIQQFTQRSNQGKLIPPIIFTRATCLFAIEEILNSNDIEDDDTYDTRRVDFWKGLMLYILSVNHALTKIKKEVNKELDGLESLNPKLMPLHELSIETDQLYLVYRGYCLIKYFLDHPTYSEDVTLYFSELYGIEPLHFILHILEIGIMNNNENPQFNFYYQLRNGNGIKMFDALSRQFENRNVYKFLTIRKYPFVKVEKGKYLMTDHGFLVEKIYSQFLNDFWFEQMKNSPKRIPFAQYRSDFGQFFEEYISGITKNSFRNYQHSKLLVFDELKIPAKGGDIEIADVYLRFGNKILLAEAKSSNIYDEAKYGGDADALYKNDRAKFFDTFGLDQVAKSISLMYDHIQKLDSGFIKTKTYHVYPCIIINDKALQTPFMALTFDKRLKELLLNFRIDKIKVLPLTILHISDLERLEGFLIDNPNQIWDLLKYNMREKSFIPPFYNTINRRFSVRSYLPKIEETVANLIKRYNSPKSAIDSTNE